MYSFKNYFFFVKGYITQTVVIVHPFGSVHLPPSEMRNMDLTVSLNCWLCHSEQEHRNLPFMQELRNLFSLMVGSKRKYVDPSRAVEILKDAFKSSESQQVSLFLLYPAWHADIHLVKEVFTRTSLLQAGERLVSPTEIPPRYSP